MTPPNSAMKGSKRINLPGLLLRVSTGTKCIIAPSINGTTPMAKIMW